MLPAGFGNCTTCGRLLVVDGLTGGRCTRDCGGEVADLYRPASCPADTAFLAAAHRQRLQWSPALDLMSRWPEENR